MLLSDARPLVLKGLDSVINGKRPEMEVVGHCMSYGRTLDLATQLRPQVVVISFYPDEIDPLLLISKLASDSANPVLLLIGRNETSLLAQAIAAGASGYVLLEDPTEDLTLAIAKMKPSHVMADADQPAPSAASRLDVNGSREQQKQSQLTPRERQLIRIISTHPADKYLSIAHRLSISEHTVHNHLSNIYHKLKLINRIDLLVYSLKHGLNERRSQARAVATALQAFAAR